MTSPRYSIVIPVYNRPEEVAELLTSLVKQTFRNFEVVIIEDGSQLRSDHVVDKFRDSLTVQYFFKQNEGPGPSRNFGFSKARGDYFVVFDSDCIIPPGYLEAVEDSMALHHWDAWGGPDQAHENFSTLQRSMGYTMSSFLTTGGIRGGKKSVGAFQPRSFNMGLSRRVFESTGGFAFTHFAEDIELSIRMKNAGFKVGLIPDAFVYHKRRTSFGQFFQQVNNFGRGRVQVGRAHPKEVKLTHWFPSLFFIGMLVLIPMSLVSPPLFMTGAALYFLYFLSIFLHAFSLTTNIKVSLLAVPAALIQLCGYGIGFVSEKLGIKG